VLLLVTLALVVASAVLLILGFVQDALGFIYLSMLCAGVAALALFVFARLARRRGAALAGAGIAGGASPYIAASEHEEAPAFRVDSDAGTTRQMAPVAAPMLEDEELDYDEPEAPVLVAAAPRYNAPAPAELDTWAVDDDSEDWGDEIMFPIEDYDELRVAEILPLLVQLEPDELQEVRDREVSGKARGTILDRIDDRLGRRVGAPAGATAPIATPEPEPAPAAVPTRGRPPASRTAGSAPAAKKASGRKAAAPAPAARARKAPAPAPAPATRARKGAPAPAPAPVPAKATSTRKAATTAAAPARTAAKKASGAAGKAAAVTASAGRTAAKKAAPVKRAVATTAAVTKAAPAKKTATKAAPAKKAAKATAKKR
jgi:hypothetical protein